MTVRAVNGGGQNPTGSRSVKLEAQLAAPSKFTAVAGDEQVKLRWDPGAISKYQLLQIDPSKLFASDGAADDEFGISIAVDGDIAVVGARQDDTRNGSAYVFTKVSGVWSQVAKLTASDGAADDEFGYSVAVDGDTIVVGAHLDDGTDSGGNAITDSGSAYVFTKPALGWGDWSNLDTNGKAGLTTKLTAFGAAAGDEFGISVAVDGDTILVGAHQNDSNKGAAYIFTRFRGVWGNAPVSGNHRVETAKLVAADGAANDEFGISVALDGDTIVVGAHQSDSKKGAAYVFTKVSGIWGQRAKLTASDAAANDEFGIAVAVDGDTIVVGAHQNDSNKGAAYVFTKPESDGWADATETAKLTASDAAANDELGISVAVHGETIVVGAHQSDSNKGAAYVFTKPGSGGWADATETAKLTASDGAASDELGISVAVDGDTVVLGAHKYDVDDNGTSIPNAGAAYVFTKPVNGWATSTSTANLIASDAARGDEFGISVAIDDDTVVVGAYLDDDNGDNSGSAYVFTRDSNGWSQKTKLTGPSRGKGYWLGHSVAVVGNTVIAGADKSNISGPDSGAVYLWVVPQWADIVNSDATTTSLTVTGLTNRVEYSFQVRAVDNVEGVGAGPPSEVRATPLKPRPAKPTGLSAAPGDTQVRVSWDLPGESSPPTNSYQLWQHAENAMLTAPMSGRRTMSSGMP